MENKNPYGKFLKTSMLMGIGIAVFALGSIYFSMKQTGAADIVNQVFGGSFWLMVIGFVVFIILLIYVLQRWMLSSLKPKDIPNGLPATATVIRSYQGNMRVTIGGVNQNYQLIIEVNVTNPQGETWPAKMEEMINITQIGMFQPGVSFAVKYDPNDRSKVVFDQSAQTSGSQQKPFGSVNVPGYGTVDSIMANQAKQHQPQDIVLQLQATSALLNELNANGNGVTAEAEVLSKTQLIDNFMNGADAYKLRIRVNATDISSFETDVVLLIQKPSVYKIEPGKTVYVKYDRNNPQRTVISGTDKPDSAVAL